MAAFKRNVYVSPFHEDNIEKLVAEVGADHVLFGSDFPHPEGLAEPCATSTRSAGLPQADLEAIMGGNLARLLKV